jgi:hypothetical protein
MSRVRIGYAVACFGILITTGGCSTSATGPEAANVGASASRFKNPTADSVVAPTGLGGNDGATVSGGVILSGGGRYEEP